MIQQIISGLVGGLVIGLTGFGKNQSETIDFKKIGTTLVVSAIIGAIAGAIGMDYGVLANGSLIAGLTVMIENIGKTVNRRLITKKK